MAATSGVMPADATARLRRLAEELGEVGLQPHGSDAMRALVLEEIDHALRPVVHERRVASGGTIVEPTTDPSTWAAPTHLEITSRTADHQPLSDARRFADGLSSWLVRRADGNNEWAVFDRPAGSERDLVVLAGVLGATIVQRHPTGLVRVVGSFGVVRWQGLTWHHEPPVSSWIDSVTARPRTATAACWKPCWSSRSTTSGRGGSDRCSSTVPTSTTVRPSRSAFRRRRPCRSCRRRTSRRCATPSARSTARRCSTPTACCASSACGSCRAARPKRASTPSAGPGIHPVAATATTTRALNRHRGERRRSRHRVPQRPRARALAHGRLDAVVVVGLSTHCTSSPRPRRASITACAHRGPAVERDRVRVGRTDPPALRAPRRVHGRVDRGHVSVARSFRHADPGRWRRLHGLNLWIVRAWRSGCRTDGTRCGTPASSSLTRTSAGLQRDTLAGRARALGGARDRRQRRRDEFDLRRVVGRVVVVHVPARDDSCSTGARRSSAALRIITVLRDPASCTTAISSWSSAVRWCLLVLLLLFECPERAVAASGVGARCRVRGVDVGRVDYGAMTGVFVVVIVVGWAVLRTAGLAAVRHRSSWQAQR